MTVSVVTSTYNKADLLRRTVTSVLAQTAPPIEYLVADDGSTDHTAQVLAEFGERVTHLRLPHRGLPAAPRNSALAVARGEWLAFVDHDDLWQPDKLEQQLKLVAPDVGILCSNAILIDGDDRPLGRDMHEAHPLTKEPDPVRALIGGNFVVCSSVLARASLIREVGGFCEDPVLTGVDDYDLWMRCCLRTRLVYEHAPRVLYRWGHGNLSLRDAPMRHVEALALVRRRFVEAAGARAQGELAEPLRQNWRRLQHARYKAYVAEGRWWQALAPWLSVQAEKVRGRH